MRRVTQLITATGPGFPHWSAGHPSHQWFRRDELMVPIRSESRPEGLAVRPDQEAGNSLSVDLSKCLTQHDGTTLIVTDNMERVLADIDANHGNCGVECLRHSVLLVFGAPSQHSIAGGDRSTAGPVQRG
jgi:hypothetical protein